MFLLIQLSQNACLQYCIMLQEDRPSPVASSDVIVTGNTENTITQSRTSKILEASVKILR